MPIYDKWLLEQQRNSLCTGPPTGGPAYKQPEERSLKYSDHLTTHTNVTPNGPNNIKDSDFFINDHEKHFIRDTNDTISDPTARERKTSYTEDSVEIPVFSGSATNINPLNDPTKEYIIQNGLENYEINRVGNTSPPISPLQPFTRMDPQTAQIASLTTYNRTKTPIADIEFRKGFRHIFFTRPECYIMSFDNNGGLTLSEQAKYDEDFLSCYNRMPHILKLLSPIYVSGSFSNNSSVNSNWNYLLMNRVQGMNTSTISAKTPETVSRSISGYTVTPAGNLESRQGSTIDFSFTDTKNLEIFEMLRMWLLYTTKRYKGIFAPSYNGYKYRNGFIPISKEPIALPNELIYHPYDRALDYGASVFDVVTNESMTKILYWCKYYGIYPISVTPEGLSNENNAPLSSMTTKATFKYHYKLENSDKSLVEFNYNAGLTDDLGVQIKDNIKSSLPFLLRDDYNNSVLKKYIGAAGMFTGSPYIVMGRSQLDPLDTGNYAVSPYLRFMPIDNEKLDNTINMGLTNNITENMKVLGLTNNSQ